MALIRLIKVEGPVHLRAGGFTQLRVLDDQFSAEAEHQQCEFHSEYTAARKKAAARSGQGGARDFSVAFQYPAQNHPVHVVVASSVTDEYSVMGGWQ